MTFKIRPSTDREKFLSATIDSCPKKKTAFPRKCTSEKCPIRFA